MWNCLFSESMGGRRVWSPLSHHLDQSKTLSNNGIIASLSWFMSLFHQNFSCFHSVKSKSESINCSVMSNSLWPQDHSPVDSSVHWILWARILEWVASSSSRGSSPPRDLTWVSCIAGSLFTIWARREALRVKDCVKMRRKISFGLFRTSLRCVKWSIQLQRVSMSIRPCV